MKFIILLYVILIISLHLIPLGGAALNTTRLGPFRLDYLLHTALFIPWMFLFYIKPGSGRIPEIRPVRPLPFLGWMALGLVLAGAAEGIQYWIYYRGFNSMDAVFNMLGVVLGVGLFMAAKWIGGLRNCELRD